MIYCLRKRTKSPTQREISQIKFHIFSYFNYLIFEYIPQQHDYWLLTIWCWPFSTFEFFQIHIFKSNSDWNFPFSGHHPSIFGRNNKKKKICLILTPVARIWISIKYFLQIIYKCLVTKCVLKDYYAFIRLIRLHIYINFYFIRSLNY